MKTIFTANCKQALRAPGFVLGVLAVPLFLFLSQLDTLVKTFQSTDPQAYGNFLTFVEKGLQGNTMSFLMPILCALPFSASFSEDIRCGVIKSILPRTTRRAYLWGKIGACALSGGLVLAMGILLSSGLAWMILAPLEETAKEVRLQPQVLELLQKTLLFFCSGAFWAVFGAFAATLTGSRYVAYTAPFIFYYLLIILYERYFPYVVLFYPPSWLNPETGWFAGDFGVVLWVGELTAIVMAGFVLAAERRLERV
ncbi:hypothetical protein [Hominifimenecus sp. rT4P-3]|uniref:hypothetical protein n=1 Tax=Hominifimenecus sp. rT4P-3 TaxID=3242979 RepID=UPI003DA2D95D